MKAVLIATDYFKTTSNEYKVLEINTNVKVPNNLEILDWDNLKKFIQTKGFTNVHCIIPKHSQFLADKIKTICETNLTKILFELHQTDNDSITIPYIEDNDTTLILRISYDCIAIIDDVYCRDNYAFLKSIKNETYKPKTYIPNVLDDFTDLKDFTYLDNTPNFIIKKRYPNYDRNQFPSLHKINNLIELNNLKKIVNVSTEFLQEITNCELTNGKQNIIRSIDVLYGSNLDILNMGGYKIIQNEMLEIAFDDKTKIGIIFADIIDSIKKDILNQ